MKQVQRGFTLIELVMVIVILGVLAAIAIPKFVDLSSDAKMAAAKGMAGALSSGSAINYAARAVSPTNVTTAYALATGAACSLVASNMQGGQPAGYNYTGTVPNCTVTDQTYATASFSFSALVTP